MSRIIYLLVLMLLTACSDPESEQSMGTLLAPGSGGYSDVVAGHQLSFPEDHLAHSGFRQEWWYLTANLKTEKGQELGLQWTQFRIALSTEDKRESEYKDWSTRQLFMAHSAVTTKERHLASEKWSRGHPKLADVSPEPLTIKLDNWKWQASGEALFPAELSVAGDEFSYQLTLKTNSPFQLQGDQGYSAKSADGSVASYYYSQPFIEVSGEVEIEGVSQPVSGTAWLDREWSSQFLTRSQQGWDWFALRLNDGSALMLFQLRTAEGEKQNFYSAKRMYPDGRARNISPEQISIKATRYHRIENTDYPVLWHIEIPDELLDIKVSALNPNAKMPLTIPYWEGPVYFNGSHSGKGYMELTGY